MSCLHCTPASTGGRFCTRCGTAILFATASWPQVLPGGRLPVGNRGGPDSVAKARS